MLICVTALQTQAVLHVLVQTSHYRGKWYHASKPLIWKVLIRPHLCEHDDFELLRVNFHWLHITGLCIYFERSRVLRDQEFERSRVNSLSNIKKKIGAVTRPREIKNFESPVSYEVKVHYFFEDLLLYTWPLLRETECMIILQSWGSVLVNCQIHGLWGQGYIF